MPDEVISLYLFIYFSYHTREVDDFTNENKFTCKKFCKSVELGKLYYNVQLVCKENAYSNKLITLNLSTFDDQGNGFFPVPAVDLYRNSNEYQKLKDNVQKLQEMDCYISVLVEAIPTGHSESDKIYRIIGDYQNNLA